MNIDWLFGGKDHEYLFINFPFRCIITMIIHIGVESLCISYKSYIRLFILSAGTLTSVSMLRLSRFCVLYIIIGIHTLKCNSDVLSSDTGGNKPKIKHCSEKLGKIKSVLKRFVCQIEYIVARSFFFKVPLIGVLVPKDKTFCF